MFISSLWDVKEPTHYSRRVGDGVPGVVAVLFSVSRLTLRILTQRKWPAWRDVSKKAYGKGTLPSLPTLPNAGTCRRTTGMNMK